MPIIIKRNESNLSITLDSGIGWNLDFNHSEACSANAEAWRRYLQSELDKQEMYKINELNRLKMDICDLRSELATERRRSAALRGLTRKCKSS